MATKIKEIDVSNFLQKTRYSITLESENAKIELSASQSYYRIRMRNKSKVSKSIYLPISHTQLEVTEEEEQKKLE